MSFAEHNGSHTTAYKNLFDWLSRIDIKIFQDKLVVYLSTSPGPDGAAGVLASAVESASHFGADLKASLSIPSFHKVFDTGMNQVINADIEKKLRQAISRLKDTDKLAA